MPTKLLVANWKLHKTIAEARAWADACRGPLTALAADVSVAVAPPATALWPLAQALAGTRVLLVAQAVDEHDSGAFTGALGAPLLAEAGARYALVGHSERRRLYGDAPARTAAQLAACLRSGLTPLLCVGEDAAERSAGRTREVVERQLEAVWPALATQATTGGGPRLVVAYEPVWAIGSGHSATPDQAAEVHGQLRAWLAARLGARAAGEVPLLYGGSVAANNVAAFAAQNNVDGALVGGASLDADSFVQLANQLARAPL